MKKAFLVAACVQLVAQPSAADLAEIRKAGTLRVIVVAANSSMPGKSPFLAVEKDAATGIDAEVLRGFARSQGLGLVFAQLPAWERLVPALVEGQGDLIAGNVAATDARRSQLDFSVETMPTRALLVSYGANGPYASLERLGAEKLAVLKGTLAADVLLAAGVPRANLTEESGAQALLDDLRDGRVKAAALDLIAALEAQRRDDGYRLGGFVGPTVSLAFGVRKDCPRLREALDAHIASLKRSPSWYRLLLASFGPAAPAALAQLKADRH